MTQYDKVETGKKFIKYAPFIGNQILFSNNL